MAEIRKNSINIVALGRQNPQIINVDWLLANKIIPKDEPPFKEIINTEKRFTRFVTTPVLTNLIFGPVEFIVDVQRFQIQDNAIGDWKETKILKIAENYFRTLCHTPLNLVGINLSAKMVFSSEEEDAAFQSLFLPNGAKILELIDQDLPNANVTLKYPFYGRKGRSSLTINQKSKDANERIINFNYEFDYESPENLQSELSAISEVFECYDSLLGKILKAF